jgi:hypothetical protein
VVLSVNGLLDGETFRSVTAARVVIENLLEEYNHLHPQRRRGSKLRD